MGGKENKRWLQDKEDGRRGGGEVNVKGNAITGFVQSCRLSDGRTRINETNEWKRARVWEKGAPFFTVFSEESIAVCSVHVFMANACLSHEWEERGGRHAARDGDRESVLWCEFIEEHVYHACDMKRETRKCGLRWNLSANNVTMERQQ